MSEKRFVIKKGSSGDYDIYDNLKGDYFIGDSSLPVNSFAEEIVDLLNEQQAIIRKLQDLCGQSDGENAKLRQENKEQQATIEQKDKQLEKAKEYFQDYLSKEMSADKFSEMWDLVIDDE